jgi:hypothetical protein
MQTLTSFTRSIRSATATTAEAKREALSWLASQLSWERTLHQLRDGQVKPAAKAA